MNKFFSYDGLYFRIFNFLANLIILNFMFLLSALSIILLGPGVIAFYKTLNELYHDKHLELYKTYRHHLQANFKRGQQLILIVLSYLAAVAFSLLVLMELSRYLGYFAIVLLTFSGVVLAVYILLFSNLKQGIKATFNDALYVTLSGFANGIIILGIPVLISLVLIKINFFLFLALGFSVASYLQIIFLNQVLLEKDVELVQKTKS